MINFTTYKPSGKITSSGSVPIFDIDNQIIDTGELRIFKKSNLQTDYIDITTNTIKPKIDLILISNKITLTSDNVDSIVLSNLPIPCIVTIDENTYEVPDGEFEFTTDTVGIYSITVESIPYFPATIEVTAI